MFIFAHAGITLGSAVLVSGLYRQLLSSSAKAANCPVEDIDINHSTSERASLSRRIGLDNLAGFLDIRLLLIGSLIPDIIDKPLSFLGFGNGRSITHTLLVSVIVLIISLYLYTGRRRTWLMAISLGMFTHLILDFMWDTPYTLFWPFYGWRFPTPVNRVGLDQIRVWANTMATNPSVDIYEVVGFLIVAIFVGILIYRKNLRAFLMKGKV